jgi:hypothetical protein
MGSTVFPASFSCWKNNEALVIHFEEAKNDSTREKHGDAHMKDYRKIRTTNYILDLSFLCGNYLIRAWTFKRAIWIRIWWTKNRSFTNFA